jgi:hypothetical protein
MGINPIQITQEEWEKKLLELKKELDKAPNKEMKRLITRRIRNVLKILDRFHVNEAFRNLGNDYKGIEDLEKVQESEGWAPYRLGYTSIGNAYFYN